MVLGKLVSLYLSDSEARELKAFCDANQCTQYNALKTAVRQLLEQPVYADERGEPEIAEEKTGVLLETGDDIDVAKDESEDPETQIKRRLLQRLRSMNE